MRSAVGGSHALLWSLTQSSGVLGHSGRVLKLVRAVPTLNVEEWLCQLNVVTRQKNGGSDIL